MKQVILVVVLLVLAGFVGYKVGDSRGFEAGYRAGYIIDCKDDVMRLKQQHESLKKAVDLLDGKANEVGSENSFLRYRQYRLEQNPSLIEDSVRLAPEVQRKRDSIAKLKDPSGLYVDPYTGKVQKGVLRALRDEGKK